eukprot:8390207-Alexandrium_andersonii.AAC.1
MSASLVGSEMCIRDRAVSLAEVSEAALHSARGGRSPSTLKRPTDPRPVSYTHLTLPTICSV